MDKCRGRAFSDGELMAYCLATSQWKGSFMTAFVTSPPVDLITNLFSALAETSLRPSELKLKISPPNDLNCLKLTAPQHQAINTVLSRSQNLYCNISRWARKDSLAENNSRPRSEMLALSSFTNALFYSNVTLTCLNLTYDGYPAFYERPTASISDFIPSLMKENSFPKLRWLYLSHIPFHIADVQNLVTGLRNTLESLSMKAPYLLSETWSDVLTTLRGLEKLQKFQLEYPLGTLKICCTLQKSLPITQTGNPVS
jgi:hypothetical protein